MGHDSPGGQLEPNRIPAPAGPFLGALRLYDPNAKVQNDQMANARPGKGGLIQHLIGGPDPKVFKIASG